MRSNAVIAIDPGPENSALVVWDGTSLVNRLYGKNLDILHQLRHLGNGSLCVIERVASYGMPVGVEVFETVYWSGRFAEAYGAENVERIPRLMVKMHLCHDSRAKDANVRRALIDRFGQPGTKARPGILYGVSGDLWAALALAVTWWDTNTPAIPAAAAALKFREAQETPIAP
jgi:hypothetical protein